MCRRVIARVLLTSCLLLAGWGLDRSSGSDVIPSELASWMIGYSEHRTDLPGGRQANVRTNRAVVIRADGTGRRSLGEGLLSRPGSWTQFAGWSPRGDRAIIGLGWESAENARWEEANRTFRFIPEGWSYDMILVDLASGSAENLTAVERVSFYNTGLFFWPGESGRLGFTALIDGQSKPFRMGPDGRGKTDLSGDSQGFAYGFSGSPDGKRISYHQDYQVYLADADGSNRMHVRTGHPFVFAPTWSPDGKWLLFLSGEHYACHPHVVKADGTGLLKVGDRGGYRGVTQFLDVADFHDGSSDVPVWDVSGDSIFFTGRVGEHVELFRVVPGGEPRQLTHPQGRRAAGEVTHYHPRPSPDGRWLLYGSRRDGVRDLYVMRLSDGAQYRVTRMTRGMAAMHAHWRPAHQLEAGLREK